jgi:hypothetical protein
VIKKTFGMWKSKCRILKLMASYGIKDQILLVVATVLLHNFIRIHDMNDKGA